MLASVSISPHASALTGGCSPQWAGPPRPVIHRNGEHADDLFFDLGPCKCRFDGMDQPVAYVNPDGSVTVIDKSGTWVTLVPPSNNEGTLCVGLAREMGGQ